MSRHRILTLTATLTVAAVIGAGAAIAAGTTAPPPRAAFVANAYVPADALAAGPAAGRLGAPIFTTAQNALSDSAEAGLTAYHPDLVVVLGGPAAIADRVVTEISSATGLAVRDAATAPSDGIIRVAGDERTQTAQKIADLFSAYDPAFLPADGKAYDADLLDGKDSTDFASRQEPLHIATATMTTATAPSNGDTIELLQADVTTADECGDGTTTHRYLASVTGYAGVFVSATPGQRATPRIQLTLDSTTLEPGPGFSIAQLETNSDGRDYAPMAQQYVFDGVAPGVHAFRVLGDDPDTSGGTDPDFEQFTLVVTDLGWTCA